MTVAICDDNAVFRTELKEMVVEYQKTRRIAIVIMEYENGTKLLKDNRSFDMVFMDWVMPGQDGLDTAKKIRIRNFLCGIIFVTGFPGYVFKSFEVQPFRYFVKPLDKQELFSALDSYLAQQKLMNPIMIVENGERKIIPTDEIVYLEADRKYTVIRTSKGEFRCAKTLCVVDGLLPMHCFFRVHKSYTINMYCISSVGDHTITLINGEKIPLSRARASDFLKAYQIFVKTYYVRW